MPPRQGYAPPVMWPLTASQVPPHEPSLVGGGQKPQPPNLSHPRAEERCGSAAPRKVWTPAARQVPPPGLWVMGKGANLPTYLSRRRTRAARVPLTINRRHLVIKRPHKR